MPNWAEKGKNGWKSGTKGILNRVDNRRSQQRFPVSLPRRPSLGRPFRMALLNQCRQLFTRRKPLSGRSVLPSARRSPASPTCGLDCKCITTTFGYDLLSLITILGARDIDALFSTVKWVKTLCGFNSATGTSPGTVELEALFETQWRKNLFAAALERVKQKFSLKHFQIFDLLVLKEWPASDVARSLGVTLASVYVTKHRISVAIMKETKTLEKQLGQSAKRQIGQTGRPDGRE
jgi:hypothetical protein